MSYVHDEDVPVTTCPACGNDNYGADSFLGGLGNLSHYRCRYCGTNYSYTTSPDLEEGCTDETV